MSQRRLFNYQEAADYLSLSTRSMWDLGNTNVIPKIQIGRCVRFDIEDLDRYIESRKQLSGSM